MSELGRVQELLEECKRAERIVEAERDTLRGQVAALREVSGATLKALKAIMRCILDGEERWDTGNRRDAWEAGAKSYQPMDEALTTNAGAPEAAVIKAATVIARWFRVNGVSERLTLKLVEAVEEMEKA